MISLDNCRHHVINIIDICAQEPCPQKAMRLMGKFVREQTDNGRVEHAFNHAETMALYALYGNLIDEKLEKKGILS